eukprot:2686834-Amphidinium_carterae.1
MVGQAMLWLVCEALGVEASGLWGREVCGLAYGLKMKPRLFSEVGHGRVSAKHGWQPPLSVLGHLRLLSMCGRVSHGGQNRRPADDPLPIGTCVLVTPHRIEAAT